MNNADWQARAATWELLALSFRYPGPELAGAVAEMKACKGAYLLEVRVESEENVFPMVPAGAPVSAIRLE